MDVGLGDCLELQGLLWNRVASEDSVDVMDEAAAEAYTVRIHRLDKIEEEVDLDEVVSDQGLRYQGQDSRRELLGHMAPSSTAYEGVVGFMVGVQIMYVGV